MRVGSPQHVDASPSLTIALACIGGDWPYDDWPEPDDGCVGRTVQVSPPYRALAGTTVDAVVLHCEDPSRAFPALLDALGAEPAPVVVVSPRQDTEAVVEVFRAGGCYLVEDDYHPRVLSSAVLAATAGHTYLSPVALSALREGWRMAPAGDPDAALRLRALLSPRERQIMELLSTGMGAQEIGARLRLREKTVRNNLSNIYTKLNARGSTDAVLRWLGATSPALPA